MHKLVRLFPIVDSYMSDTCTEYIYIWMNTVMQELVHWFLFLLSRSNKLSLSLYLCDCVWVKCSEALKLQHWVSEHRWNFESESSVRKVTENLNCDKISKWATMATNGHFPANFLILDGKNYDQWSMKMKVILGVIAIFGCQIIN